MRRAAVNDSSPYFYANISVCFDYYSDYYSPQGNGLILVKNGSTQESLSDSLLLWASIIPRFDDWAKNLWALENGSFPAKGKVSQPKTTVTRWFIGKPHYEVDYCLLQQPPWSEKQCQLEYCPWILWTVCFFNLTKMMVIFTIWWANRRARQARSINSIFPGSRKDDRLDTLGDAIQSFMRYPDLTTKTMCLPTWRDFQAPLTVSWGIRKRRGSAKNCSYKRPREWQAVTSRWRDSTSPRQWCLVLFM